jgi:hypothetical protein
MRQSFAAAVATLVPVAPVWLPAQAPHTFQFVISATDAGKPVTDIRAEDIVATRSAITAPGSRVWSRHYHPM